MATSLLLSFSTNYTCGLSPDPRSNDRNFSFLGLCSIQFYTLKNQFGRLKFIIGIFRPKMGIHRKILVSSENGENLGGWLIPRAHFWMGFDVLVIDQSTPSSWLPVWMPDSMKRCRKTLGFRWKIMAAPRINCHIEINRNLRSSASLDQTVQVTSRSHTIKTSKFTYGNLFSTELEFRRPI